MSQSFVLGIDQGSSGSKAVISDSQGQVHGFAYRPLDRLHPRLGWVEQAPDAVAQGVSEAVTEAIGRANIHPDDIVACGIAGQRNTAFTWDAGTRRPLANAITWQDQRTAGILAELSEWPSAHEVQFRLGYAPGAYMAALHLAWSLRHNEGIRRAARNGDLRIGLSPAWLLTALGRPSSHAMDASLIQAMGLYDIRAGRYWQEWLDWLGVPEVALPEVVPTLHEYGAITVSAPDGSTAEVPVLAMIGDQQSALFGQNCRTIGAAECTHGTASYVKVFLGEQAPVSENVYVYYAWNLGRRQTYCLEAPTTVTGAAMRWMRDQVGWLADYDEMDQMAASVEDSGGIIFVPALTGLEFPSVDQHARGTIFGLSLGNNRGHLYRAFFDAIGFQIRTILEEIRSEAEFAIDHLLVSGGLSTSDSACRIQANLLGIPVVRPTFTETTAWAAGLLAGLGAGLWATEEALPPLPGTRDRFEPTMSREARDAGYERWKRAVTLVRQWSAGEEQEE